MKFVLVYAAVALAINGGLDGVVTVDTTTLPDTTRTVVETETASPPPPPSTEESEKDKDTTTTKLAPPKSTKAPATDDDTTTDKASDTAADDAADSSAAAPTSAPAPLTTTLYPLLTTLKAPPAPLVVTVYASNPDTTTSSTTDGTTSLIVTPGAAIVSSYESVSARVTTIPTTYPVTTINGRTITLVDVTIDSLAAAAGKTGGGGAVITLYQTVVSGKTSNIVSTLFLTRTGLVTAHPYETLLPVTMTLNGAIVVVTKKTTVTPLNNWGTKWDQLVWIDTTYYSSPPPFTYTGAVTALANGAGGLVSPLEYLRATSWTWVTLAAMVVMVLMAL